MLKDAPGGAVLWHFGSWCFVLGRSSGAYFFQLPEGLGVAVTWDGCLGSAHTRALDEALSRAIR